MAWVWGWDYLFAWPIACFNSHYCCNSDCWQNCMHHLIYSSLKRGSMSVCALNRWGSFNDHHLPNDSKKVLPSISKSAFLNHIPPQKKTSISFWSCSVLIVPLYKRYKQTAFALHVNGYLQERGECVCMCVRSSPRQPELSEENTAVIIKGTKHWRLKTHERKRKHTSQSRRSQTLSLMHKHSHWCTQVHF